ncbi:hypothetical protein PENTCL1PPCAC_26215, partial [Pristionchus entomophagus]
PPLPSSFLLFFLASNGQMDNTRPLITAFMQKTAPDLADFMMKLWEAIYFVDFNSSQYLAISPAMRISVLLHIYKAYAVEEKVLSEALSDLSDGFYRGWKEVPFEESPELHQLCADLISAATNETRAAICPYLANMIAKLAEKRIVGRVQSWHELVEFLHHKE